MPAGTSDVFTVTRVLRACVTCQYCIFANARRRATASSVHTFARSEAGVRAEFDAATSSLIVQRTSRKIEQ